uniref:DNA repair metallo-beta-lactamase domain-containing protein n=1 Tax=Heliothis virescens TaxID=7102 RepID=A0A2A4K007_HELVI
MAPHVLKFSPLHGQGDAATTTLFSKNSCNSFVSRSSLSLKRNNGLKLKPKKRIHPVNKENSPNVQNLISQCSFAKSEPKVKAAVDKDSLGFSAIDDLQSEGNHFDSCSLSIVEAPPVKTPLPHKSPRLISVSSNTELDQNALFDSKSDTTVIYNALCGKPTISVSFGIDNCQRVDINSKKSSIKRVLFSHNNDNTQVDCEIIEGSKASTESDDLDENMNELLSPNSLKRSAVTVNLEIKKKKPSSTETAENKVLILNTSAIEKISHVIVQPPNYKLVKGKILDKSKFKSDSKRNSVIGFTVNNGKVRDRLKQKPIDSFFPKRTNVLSLKVSEGRSLADPVSDVKPRVIKNGDEEVMSRNSGVADAIKERSRKSPYKGSRVDNDVSNRSTRVPSPRQDVSPRPELKTCCSSPRGKESPSSHSPRKTVESIQFSLPPKSVSTKRSVSTRNIPHHKIVAGTHFAVDAFSYGEIPNVKHYFLTHFHSDHYSGLKKGFNKLLFCSKITADLCISRLGVSPKCIHTIKIDETIRIDGVEVTAVEANHCPGAIMLVFTLPNGKTLLHTGDFRASPVMESYPVFWNKDIHTIYLDTTYCNPRYDFPTQEQSLEMALYILRQKKVALEKVGKKFSSVLIVCGTYTIGKEKFFLGMSRRVGCSVWACPEKDRVLQAVEGRSFSHAPPHSCQLHVVPMRDLTHEKLRSYLDSLKGAFSEIVAFKPSGWENGKSTSVERDMVTIHGIPYSEHSSFSELIRFVKFLKPKQVVPTVDISGGVRAVQKYFPCPLVHKEEIQCQSKVTDFFSIQNQQQVPAVT